MRASNDGTAMPVTVVVAIMSTSCGSRPASSSAPEQRLAAELHRVFDEDLVGLAEVGQRRVLLERQYQVAAVDLRAGVQTPNDFLVLLQNRRTRRIGR